MFEDLYDAISFLWSSAWPTVQGEVTAIDVECIKHARRGDTWRLAIAYKFLLGNDGPYTGESFWSPAIAISHRKRVTAAQRRLHVGQPVLVRYRRDDPSLSRLDRAVWRDL